MRKLSLRNSFQRYQENRYVQQTNQTPKQSTRGIQNKPSSLILFDYHHHTYNPVCANINNKRCIQNNTNIHQKFNRPVSTTEYFDDDEIIFTENKIYVGIQEDILAEHTSNLRNIQNKVSPVKNTLSPSKRETKLIFDFCQKKTVHINPQPRDVPANTNGLQSSETVSSEIEPTSKRLSEYDNVNTIFWHSHNDNDTIIGNWIENNHMKQFDADAQNLLNISLAPIPSTANANMVKNINEIYCELPVSASSRRTSISTSDTWIDDEEFDNSFNEELEMRCAKYGVKCF